MKNKKNILVRVFAVLIILVGLRFLIGSLPLYELSKNISSGGLYLKGNGIGVGMVYPSSPAESAGIKQEDVITEVNGVQIVTAADFLQIINQNKGIPIRLTIQREGQSNEITLIPRTVDVPGQGPTGMNLREGGYTFEKEPIILIVPKTIILSYQGKLYQDQFQSAANIISRASRTATNEPVAFSEPDTWSKVYSLLIGLLIIVIGIGIFKKRK